MYKSNRCFISRIFYFFLSFTLVVVFLSCDVFGIESGKNKPEINANTQIRTEYGCKRPNWDWKEYTVFFNDEQIKCYMNTRNFLLYKSSLSAPILQTKKCYKNKQERICCKVVAGEWKVFDGNQEIIEIDVGNLQIDHVLPFSYIRLNMKNCKLAGKYFNFIDNLAVMYGAENLKKKDNLCETREECEKQKKICNKIAENFADKNLCDELNKIDIEFE